MRKAGWKKWATYSKSDIQRAANVVERGCMSIREAAKFYVVPRSTLQDLVNGTHKPQDGRCPELSEKEEARLAVHVEICASWSFPFSWSDLCHMVKAYLDTKGTVSTRFKNNLPTHRSKNVTVPVAHTSTEYKIKKLQNGYRYSSSLLAPPKKFKKLFFGKCNLVFLPN